MKIDIMNIIGRMTFFLLILVAAMGCRGTSVNDSYDPSEFTLLIATSNHGEVGPCG
ncbi:MAG: hypothetical protein K9N35_09395 [Candidatus Marinimicrobia bacterium]|nr:hypothetical protein [Candidatus Neomarinimicrobiota bacterium]